MKDLDTSRNLLAGFLEGRLSLEDLKGSFNSGELIGITKEIHADAHELTPEDLLRTNYLGGREMTYREFEELAKRSSCVQLVILRQSDIQSDAPI